MKTETKKKQEHKKQINPQKNVHPTAKRRKSQHIVKYNIYMEELQDPLRRAHTTSAGPDEIHYQ